MVRIHPDRERIVILTGAGISAGSGLSTFRGSNGIWNNESIEDVATPGGFSRNPPRVWEFYNRRRAELPAARPNPAHFALAELQKLKPDHVMLITQNVDDLHEKAGSDPVYHMHGELCKVRCLDCRAVYSDDSPLDAAPRCFHCNGILRPHIVWFGEIPFFLDEIERALLQCDWFISVGTSGHVHPAARFLNVAKSSGANTVVVNPDPAADESDIDYFVQEKAEEALPLLIDEWCGTAKN
jgi:NAD-dependent deacetylase